MTLSAFLEFDHSSSIKTALVSYLCLTGITLNLLHGNRAAAGAEYLLSEV